MIEKIAHILHSQLFAIILIYWVSISLMGVIITIIDKRKAIRQRWRIKEKSLMVCALLGGAGAMYVTMRLIRHKTKHAKFMVGLPIVIIIHITLFVTLFCVIP